MRHLYILYFLCTFLVGGISLAIAIFLYLKTKKRAIRFYLLFYVPFTMVVVFFTAVLYLETNVPAISSTVLKLLEYFGTLNLLSLTFVVPVSIHYYSSVTHARRRNIYFGGVTLTILITYHVIEFIIGNERIAFWGELVLSGMFVAVMIYCAIIDMGHYKKIQDTVKKHLGRKGNFLLMIFLPGLCYDMFLGDNSAFRFYPLLYCGFSLLFTNYFLKNYTSNQTIPEEASISEDLFTRYNISVREQEIITLVVHGLSNQKISERLFISLNTVKAHLRNIYPKFGITSRYELMTLINNSGRSTGETEGKS